MLNESQKRYLLTRLHSIEETLCEAAEQLEPRDRNRLFRRIEPDATATQRKVLSDFIAQLRFALRRFMLGQELRDDGHRTSGLWSLRTAITFAQITAEELRARYWRGYGEIDREAAAACERCSVELTALLRRIEDYIVRGEGGSLAARVSKLDTTRNELALLRELERVISAYGLTELRAPLEVLLDRASSPSFEIAVFGRVSAGKSSLLNWWLSQDLLPTGVTPITAVPVRLMHGEALRARIRVAPSTPFEIPLDELSTYATEHGNPGNAKRVLEILIQAPSERLRGGICLVDTPGLGSLATSGAAQTLEYLPRCDLGILLINVSGPLASEDVDVARALIEGGSEVLVVGSKADQLSEADLQQALSYLRGQFQERLAMPLSVCPVSTIASHVDLTIEWFENEVAPRLARHQEQAARVLKRKIAILRDTVTAVLEARLNSRGGRAQGPHDERGKPPESGSLRDRIAQVRADLEYARVQLSDLKLGLAAFTDRVAAAAIEELVRGWLGPSGTGQGLAQRVEAVMAQSTDEAGEAVARMLNEMRERISQVLEESGCSAEALQELDAPRGRPILDAAAIPRLARYDRPAWLPRLSFLARTLAGRRIRRTMVTALGAQLAVYGETLCHWGTRYVRELEERFEAAVAARESTERFGSESSLAAATADAARHDLELLSGWSASAKPEDRRGTTRSQQPV